MGLLDFYKMVVTVLKTSYWKIELKVINYWDFKVFISDKFRESLPEILSRRSLLYNCDEELNNFIDTCNAILERALPGK